MILLYATIIYGSFATAWGIDFTPTLEWWRLMVTRGVESVLDTTFLSAFATPIAALTGMMIAFLVVRKKFSGKDTLDFISNLGGAVPGTILGIGFVLAFSTPPTLGGRHPLRAAGILPGPAAVARHAVATQSYAGCGDRRRAWDWHS